MQKFVILSGSRSGTSLLSSTLSSHPDLVCHGEVFHKRPANHVRGNLQGKSNEELEPMREDVPKWMDTIYGQPNVSAVGFKMWHTQNPEIGDQLMADESVLKIVYERTNMLARFTSSRLVKATGVYNRNVGAKDDSYKGTQIDFDRKLWNKYVIRHNRLFDTYRANTKGPVLNLTYEELLRNGFDPVLDFLGVEKMGLISQKVKLHGSNILERFTEEAQAEVSALLEEIGHPEWAHENKS